MSRAKPGRGAVPLPSDLDQWRPGEPRLGGRVDHDRIGDLRQDRTRFERDRPTADREGHQVTPWGVVRLLDRGPQGVQTPRVRPLSSLPVSQTASSTSPSPSSSGEFTMWVETHGPCRSWPTENSEVPSGPVAVAVTTAPAGRPLGRVRVKATSPTASVVTCALPRYDAPSPCLLASQAPEMKNCSR